MSLIDEKISEIQSLRCSNGNKYENQVIAEANELGFDVLNIHGKRMYSAKDKYSDRLFFMDGLCGKYFIEITTSIGDGKSSKIVNSSKHFKEQYPNCKILVLAKSVKNPRKSDGMDSEVDYLKAQPTIDRVFIGKENLFNFIREIKGKEGKLQIPFKYKNKTEINNNSKTQINNKIMDLNLIRTFIDAGDLTYANKVYRLMNKETVDVIPTNVKPKTSSRDLTAQQRTYEKQKALIRQKKELLENHARPVDSYSGGSTLIDCRKYFKKNSNENVHKMGWGIINELSSSNALYYSVNQRGGKDLYLDVPTYEG